MNKTALQLNCEFLTTVL